MRALAIVCLLATTLSAQKAEWTFHRVAVKRGGEVKLGVLGGARAAESKPRPLLFVVPPRGEKAEALAERLQGFVAAGWTVAAPLSPFSTRHHAGLLRTLRIHHHALGQRFTLLSLGSDHEAAFSLCERRPWQFSSLVLLGAQVAEAFPPRRASPEVKLPLRVLVSGEHPLGDEAYAHLSKRFPNAEIEGVLCESADARTLAALSATWKPKRAAGARGAIDAVLDDLHDAAARADGDRYFGLFKDDGVFLGTDATERWTRPEFEAWGRRYFEGESAWIFVPQRRFVGFLCNGRAAWFDEVLENEHYGECRGSGALELVDGRWRIAEYNLSVPIPNPLLAEFAQRIRDEARFGQEREHAVWVIRHAEKESGKDPALTAEGKARAEALARMLERVSPSALISSEYRRTRDTLAPLAEAKRMTVETVPARELMKLLSRISAMRRKGDVVVCGHSNTVPVILRALGIADAPKLEESEYGDLFLVQPAPGKPSLKRLRVGK